MLRLNSCCDDTSKALPALALAALLVMSCEEELPERIDPGKVFSSGVTSSYHLDSARNVLIVTVAIKNAFDETLDGTAEMDGWLEIRLNRAPQYRKTFKLTDAQLSMARSYSTITKHLTIDPGEEIAFQVIWNFVDDNGANLPQDVFLLTADPVCNTPPGPLRRIGREEFMLSGSVTVFPRLSAVNINPTLYSLCYADRYYVIGHQCPPFQCP